VTSNFAKKNRLRLILMKLSVMLEVDEAFKMIWLSRSSEVRVKVRRWPQSPFGTVFISLSLSIRTMKNKDSWYTCVGWSVWPESVLWQNGWLDLDAIWDGEWGRSKDGCIRWGWWASKEKGQFWR